VNAPPQSSTVLASDGTVIASFYAENRAPVALEKMSPFIRDRIVSIEEARSYQHGGIDTTGILRALVATAQGGRQGASTITQHSSISATAPTASTQPPRNTSTSLPAT
jgi:membrane carboxypeptidase/penicillin-binding protein